MNDFYRFVTAEADDEPTSAELMIFDTIGNWEDIGEVSCKGFARELSKLPTSVKRLDIHINSPGGSVFDAQGIYSRLADHRATKHVYIDGLAASAASIIAMVGHKVYIRANANMMIHLPSAITMGNEDDHDKTMRALSSITSSMLNTYAKKTGLDKGEIRNMLSAETWMDADEAVEKGFADEVRGVIKAAAMVDEKRVIVNGCTFDVSRFQNLPTFAKPTNPKGHQMPKVTKPVATVEDPPDPPQDPPTPEPAPQPADPPTPPEPPKPTSAPPGTIPKKPAKEFEDGVTAERARVTALQALDRPATHDIITAAIKDGKQPDEIFAACMDAMDKANKQQARRADASGVNNIPPSDGGGDEGKTFGSLLVQKVNARKGRRVRLSGNRK